MFKHYTMKNHFAFTFRS